MFPWCCRLKLFWDCHRLCFRRRIAEEVKLTIEIAVVSSQEIFGVNKSEQVFELEERADLENLYAQKIQAFENGIGIIFKFAIYNDVNEIKSYQKRSSCWSWKFKKEIILLITLFIKMF